MVIKRMFGFPNYGWTSVFDELERMRRDIARLLGQVFGPAYWPTQAASGHC